MRHALVKTVQSHQPQGIADSLALIGPLPHAVGHVFCHRHVREERVVLEDHAHAASFREDPPLRANHANVADFDYAGIGDFKPAMSRRKVVLPHPLGPSRPRNSPGATVRSTAFTATTEPKRLVTFLQRIAYWLMLMALF